jgi:hypothetical protein
MALGSTQPLVKMSTRNISGNLNLVEHSGPHRARYGTPLPSHLSAFYYAVIFITLCHDSRFLTTNLYACSLTYVLILFYHLSFDFAFPSIFHTSFPCEFFFHACYILLHTVTYCYILLHTVTYCYILLHTVTYSVSNTVIL